MAIGLTMRFDHSSNGNLSFDFIYEVNFVFKVILFFNFAQFWFKFLLIFKQGYLSDLNFESLDYVSLDSLFHQISVIANS